MKSSVATAVLGTAIFSQLSVAATIGHNHGHFHRHVQRAAEPAAEPGIVSGAIAMLTSADQALISGLGMLAGKNVVGSQGSAPITLGQNGGNYVVEFNNNADEDVVVVVWNGASSWVNANQPAITRSLPANKTMHVSFDPSQAGGSISGGWAAVYSDTQLVNGQVSNTWGEYTFAGQWSTTDVSRLVNMNGHPMALYNYPAKTTANDGSGAACASTMTECVFTCQNLQGDANSCEFDYLLENCPVGGAGNMASADGQNGGCGGMPDGGWVVVNLS